MTGYLQVNIYKQTYTRLGKMYLHILYTFKDYSLTMVIPFVAAHPTFVDTFVDQYVQTGQKISIRCIATGNPTPEIRWKLDGEILTENSDIKIGSFLNPAGDVVSYVNISNVHLHYGGEYQCISSNEVGEIHHVGQMFVYGMQI